MTTGFNDTEGGETAKKGGFWGKAQPVEAQPEPNTTPEEDNGAEVDKADDLDSTAEILLPLEEDSDEYVGANDFNEMDVSELDGPASTEEIPAMPASIESPKTSFSEYDEPEYDEPEYDEPE